MSGQLTRLQTDLGERSTYDAASQCSRCGYCEQACPTYVATGEESKSPRGRNQLVRLMLEGKLKDKASAWESLSSCLLCGACATACYAHVPTADLVLEGRRMIRGEAPRLVRILTSVLVSDPKLLAMLLKLGYLLKRLGLSRLAAPFLGGLGVADRHIDETPSSFLNEELKKMPAAADPRWQYFAPCGPNYLYPRVGRATVAALTALKGPGRFLDNSCCGLLCFNYGEISDARVLAKRAIDNAEKNPQGPVVADCSSCAAFLKSYPQLFLEDAAWKKRAEAFAGRVKDAAEALGDAALPCAEGKGTVTYHDSCRARHGQGIANEPREAVRKVCGGSFRELPEADVCCGGAGAFSFIHPELSDDVLRRKIGAIAALQARTVVTSSTSCLIQLAHGLKKYYPEGAVVHVSELVWDALKTNGSKTRA